MTNKLEKLDNWLIRVVDFFIKLLHLRKFESKITALLNPQTIIYLVIGVLTTVVNYAVFAVLIIMIPGSEIISNTIAWIAAVAASFFPNKLFIFRSFSMNSGVISKEFISFVSSRIATLLIEAAGLYIFCDMMHFNGLVVKLFLAVIVVILNFVFSKLFVFKGKESNKKDSEKNENN